MSLNSDILGSEFSSSYNNLVVRNFRLGDGSSLEKRIEVDSASRGSSVQFVKLDKVVFLADVSRAQRLSNELGKSSVKRVLSSFESRSDRSSASCLLSTHSETTCSTLSSGNTSSLSLLGGAGTRSWLQVIHTEFEVVKVIDGGFISFPTFPIMNLHAKRRSGFRNRRQTMVTRYKSIGICRCSQSGKDANESNSRLHCRLIY
mmetsp:Transcript_78781/g.228752  ORF Transcript_78781/g.228752 Transcript_78781/m.228752 type:complete len:203 (-) Transcript_78781:84-692(-)